MKKFIVVLAALLVGTFCFAKDPCEGYWLSVDEKTNEVTAAWLITVEDGVLKGTITSSAGHPKDSLALDCKGKGPYADFPHKGNLWEMPVVGTYWIYNMKQDGEGKWSGGSIVNPQDGKKYKCKITFHAADGKKYKEDTLEMRGEIGAGIGRSQYWKRTDEATANGDL